MLLSGAWDAHQRRLAPENTASSAARRSALMARGAHGDLLCQAHGVKARTKLCECARTGEVSDEQTQLVVPCRSTTLGCVPPWRAVGIHTDPAQRLQRLASASRCTRGRSISSSDTPHCSLSRGTTNRPAVLERAPASGRDPSHQRPVGAYMSTGGGTGARCAER